MVVPTDEKDINAAYDDACAVLAMKTPPEVHTVNVEEAITDSYRAIRTNVRVSNFSMPSRLVDFYFLLGRFGVDTFERRARRRDHLDVGFEQYHNFWRVREGQRLHGELFCLKCLYARPCTDVFLCAVVLALFGCRPRGGPFRRLLHLYASPPRSLHPHHSANSTFPSYRLPHVAVRESTARRCQHTTNSFAVARRFQN